MPTRLSAQEILKTAVPPEFIPIADPTDRRIFHAAPSPFDNADSAESKQFVRAVHKILQKDTNGMALPISSIIQLLGMRAVPNVIQGNHLLYAAKNSKGYRMFWFDDKHNPLTNKRECFWYWNEQQLHPALQDYNACARQNGRAVYMDVLDIPEELVELRRKCGYHDFEVRRGLQELHKRSRSAAPPRNYAAGDEPPARIPTNRWEGTSSASTAQFLQPPYA